MIELMSLGVQLDVYECRTDDSTKYFRLSREQWEFMAKDLRSSQISLKITTVHDATFDDEDYEFIARVHIRCEKIGNTSSLPLLPLPKSRAYNLH